MAKITARFIIQIAGKPVENVEKAVEFILNKLKEEKDSFKILESHTEKPKLDEENTLYSTFIEVVARFNDSETLLGFILDYTPTSVEVESPDNIELNSHEFTGILNDFSNNILNLISENRKLNAQLNYLVSKEKK